MEGIKKEWKGKGGMKGMERYHKRKGAEDTATEGKKFSFKPQEERAPHNSHQRKAKTIMRYSVLPYLWLLLPPHGSDQRRLRL